MEDYGNYNNADDFYINIKINDKVKYNDNGIFEVGTVINTICPIIGEIKGVIIILDNKKKVVCFPRNAKNLQKA